MLRGAAGNCTTLLTEKGPKGFSYEVPLPRMGNNLGILLEIRGNNLVLSGVFMLEAVVSAWSLKGSSSEVLPEELRVERLAFSIYGGSPGATPSSKSADPNDRNGGCRSERLIIRGAPKNCTLLTSERGTYKTVKARFWH